MYIPRYSKSPLSQLSLLDIGVGFNGPYERLYFIICLHLDPVQIDKELPVKFGSNHLQN